MQYLAISITREKLKYHFEKADSEYFRLRQKFGEQMPLELAM